MSAPAGPARVHTLRDGQRILVRPVVAADRERLERGYAALSQTSRRSRFGAAPDELSPNRLDRLVDLDYDDRFALGAVAVDEPGQPGLGVARYVRRQDDPTVAEVAVVVLDEHQARGIGTILLLALIEVARAHGISMLTGTVMWGNTRLLDAVRSAGATVTPAEPGVATVQFPIAGASIVRPDRADPTHANARFARRV